MSRGSYPLLLTMALGAPGAAQAIGLGEIHIDSNLNQPLSAQIDIIGASEQDLNALRAAVANRDVFQQMGADRPAFLSTAQFKVSRDPHGRPVLSVRSSDAFTEPVVSLVIELRWPTGTLVREYTLLLDPAGLGEKPESALDARWTQTPVNTAAAAATPAPSTLPDGPAQHSVARQPEARARPVESSEPAPARIASASGAQSTGAVAAVAAVAAADATPATTSTAPTARESTSAAATYTVRANDTLQAIARQAGARSAADVRRMMIALFRANSAAFDDNINRLRSGSVLQIPDQTALASLTSYEINRDYRVQMSAWRLAGRPAASADAPVTRSAQPAADAGVEAPEVIAVSEANTDSAPDSAPASASAAELEQRVQALQTSLADMDVQIAQRDAQLFKLRQQAQAAANAPAPAQDIAIRYEVLPAQTSTADTVKRTVALGSTLGSIGALIALLRMRRRKPDQAPAPAIAQAVAPEPVRMAAPPASAAPAVAPVPVVFARPAPAPAAHSVSAVTISVSAKPNPIDEETIILDTTGDTTKNIAMDPTVALSHEEIMADLENTAHHVNMPSDLNSPAQSAPFVERRKSVIDVLRVAIEREPHRRELKMKLLEIYYAAAASNQASFLEIAKALARDRDVLATGDWERIAAMGRAITPNERLFLPDAQLAADTAPAEEDAA